MRAVGRYGGRAVRRTARLAGLAALAALFTALPAYRLTAQSSPAVRTAIQLAAEGRGDSARQLLDGHIARARAGDSSWVEGVFWRGRLAPGGESAHRDLRRIVVEYGNSPWADDALLQLAQLALAAGNPAAALDYVARLRADYPGSDLRARAALWAGRAAFDVGEKRSACALLDSAQAEAGGDIEFVNQVAFHRGRCTRAALSSTMRPARPGPDSARRDSLIAIHGGNQEAPAPRVAGRFEVQVTAARSGSAARDVVRRLARVGQRGRIVTGNGLHRVRLGPFNTNDAADSAAALARRIIGGRPFVVPLP